MLKNWLNTATLMTVVRYLLQALGGILIANGKLDPDQWETITGAVLTLAPMILGVIATAKPKVVTAEAGVVPMKALPQTTQTLVKEKAETAAARRGGLFERMGNWFRK